MKVWLSEFTYQRLVEGLGQDIPILHTSEHGMVRLELADEIVQNAIGNYGTNLDVAINETINHNQREGLWPLRKEENK